MEAFFCLKDDFLKKLGSCASDDDVVSHFSGCVMVPLLLLPLLLLVPPTVGEVGWGGQVEVFQVGFKRDRERVLRQKRRKRRREPTANKKAIETISRTSNVANVERQKRRNQNNAEKLFVYD